MKTSTSAITISGPRPTLYAKKRASPAGSIAKVSRSQPSPLHDALRRTPAELVAAQVQHQGISALLAAERELQNLLELEYKDDVKTYMTEMEAKTTASVDLIDQQPELQWYMRPYLVDFIIEIHQQHRLRPETLYLALNIVDRYVSKRIVFKKHYQLVGCAALWIAAKFEDAKDRVPTVPELCQMCCAAYDESAFIQMEGHVLSTIGWVIGHPTAEAWLRLSCVTDHMEEQRTQHVARFIMEITLFHKEYIPYKPSELAMGALLLARYLLGKSRRIADETEQVIHISQMLDVYLAEHLDKVSAIVVKKYSFPFYSRASTFVREWYLSGRRFSYFDWTSTLAPGAKFTSLASSPAAPSSCDLASSSPSSSSSDTSSSDDDSCDEDGPLTPETLVSSYSSTDPYDTAAQGKENLPRSSSKGSLLVRESMPGFRPPLNRASWELNTHSMPNVPTFHS